MDKHSESLAIIARVAKKLLSEAPGPVHENLRAKLRRWAIVRGFKMVPGFSFEESDPDVFLLSTDGNYLFVGDAKDSSNETVNTSATVSRIKKYIDNFKKDLGCSYDGGYIAIATDDKYRAIEWITKLNELCIGLVDSTQNHPAFKVEELPQGGWITYW